MSRRITRVSSAPRVVKPQSRIYTVFPDRIGDSPIATEYGDDDLRKARERKYPVHGLVVHMTGSTIVKKAVDAGADPIVYASNYYTRKDYSVHYFGDWDGMLLQFTDDRLRTPHVGVSSHERAAYLSGAWAKGKKAKGQGSEGLIGPIVPMSVKRWKDDWRYKSPQHLFPTRYVNDSYVGIELPPCGFYVRGKWTALPEHKPMHEGLRHTIGQHVAVAFLAWDLAQRWDWPDDWYVDPKGGSRSPRLPGHEDVDLFGRSNKFGGWDVGWLRKSVWFDWDFVYDVIRMRHDYPSFEVYISGVSRELLDQ